METTHVTTVSAVEDLDLEVRTYADRFQQLVNNVERVIHGKTREIRLAFLCMLAQGHLLIEDVPGTGKTSLARALAESIDGTLTRIQFTPDLLPSDVTGVQIFNQSNSEFEFHPGAVFANVVLADEINRASPKTQSSLLEVMEEYQVTVDGVPRPVPNPFLVVATQNPVEHDGTYSLPEAQIDRFMMRVAIGYPSAVAEIDIIDSAPAGRTRVDVEPVLNTEEVRQMARVADLVYISPAVRQYIVSIVRATRELPELRLGVSPRGSIALGRTARALAAANGRPFVTADDVKDLTESVLAHRMLLKPESEFEGIDSIELLRAVLQEIPTPKERVEQ